MRRPTVCEQPSLLTTRSASGSEGRNPSAWRVIHATAPIIVSALLGACTGLGSFEVFDSSDAGQDAALDPEPDLRSFSAGEEVRLTAEDGKDEDPSVLQAQDGRLIVAWFSDRAGNADIWVHTSEDGFEWTSPRRVTDETAEDFFPSLIQSRDGTFHLVWFRARMDNGHFFGRIWYRNSADLVSWSTPMAITPEEDHLNWAPTIAADDEGKLWVAWSSNRQGNHDCVIVSSNDGGGTWSEALTVTDATVHDNFPYIAYHDEDHQLWMVWQQQALTDTDPFGPPSGEIVYSTSSDGLSWSTPIRVTRDEGTQQVDVFPMVYWDRDGDNPTFAWTSNRMGAAFGDNFELEAQAAGDPAQMRRLTAHVNRDYFVRVIPTTTEHIYFMVWVSDRAPDSTSASGLDIYSRFIER